MVKITDSGGNTMFRNLLRPDSPLMITLTQITDCIFLSLFWLLGCFPVVTIGASFAAMYDATYKGFRKGERHPWQRFAYVFRCNWKEGILPTLVFFAVLAAAGKLAITMWNMAVYGQISWIFFSATAFLCVAVVGILSVLFPMLSRFENSLGGLLKNTVLIALANLPRTVALGLINVVTVMLCIRFVAPLFFAPSLAALVGSLLIEPMFKPFMKEDAAA